MSADTHLYTLINSFATQTPWLHGVMAAYALWAGLTLLAILLIEQWWVGRGRPDAPRAVATAALTGVAAVAAVLINQRLVSPSIGRTRPCHTVAHAEVLLSCANDFSMPSDHAMIAGAFVVGLLILSRRVGLLALLAALVLAFGRVYVGVHYPADTIVGLAGGAVVAAIVVLALRNPTTTLARGLTATPLRGVITATSGPTSGAPTLTTSADEPDPARRR